MYKVEKWMGKQSWVRPSKVTLEVRDLRSDLIFGTKEEKEEARARLVELGEITEESLSNGNK